MAFCRYCGGKVNDGALFCAACGRQLRDVNNVDQLDVNSNSGNGIIPPPIPADDDINQNFENKKDDANSYSGNRGSFIPVSPSPKMQTPNNEGIADLSKYSGEYPKQENGQMSATEQMTMGYQTQRDQVLQGGTIPMGYSMSQSSQIPRAYSMSQSSQIPQGYPMPQSSQIPQGYPMSQSSQIPQGYPMPQSSQIPQGYPMSQSSQIPQGYPMPQSSQIPQGYPMPQVSQRSQGYPMQNEPRIEAIIDGDFGQILKVYNDYFVVKTTDDFECYEPEARKIYKSKGTSENEKGVLEEFADVGKELGSIYGEAFAMFGEAFSSTYAENRKKKKGVLTIPEGERKEYYSACATIEGINIGQEKRGCIIIRTKIGEEILFFFDGRDGDIDEEVSEVFSEVMQPKINGQTVNCSVSINAQAGVYTSQQPMMGTYNQPMAEGDKVEQIKRIKELLDNGAISKREFARMKKEILKK